MPMQAASWLPPSKPPEPPVPFSTVHPRGRSERTSRCFFVCATLDDVPAPADV
jgi:hypothetical protein